MGEIWELWGDTGDMGEIRGDLGEMYPGMASGGRSRGCSTAAKLSRLALLGRYVTTKSEACLGVGLGVGVGVGVSDRGRGRSKIRADASASVRDGNRHYGWC